MEPDRRKTPLSMVIGIAVPIIISLASLTLSGILWVNSTQNTQDIRIALLENNYTHTQEALSRIEKEVSGVRIAIEGKNK